MYNLDEEKVFRDPIAGYVRVNNEIVWRCIESREFQRLKRIKQLGSTFMVYHTGEHSRFSHSLGVYEIIRRMVNEVKDLNNGLSDYDKTIVMLAGLLHDIGHAPFSHSFESILNKKHEDYTISIITEKSEVNDILNSYSSSLSADIASIIKGTYHNSILCQLVSSQLDADRMDYLLRDSYFTGTKYGEFDLERILRTLRVADGKVVIKSSGMHTIEDYIMARYHMYWQVYYHPVSRSYDVLLEKLFLRLKDLYIENSDKIVQQYPMFKDLLENETLTNDQMYHLDDSCCHYGFQLMCQNDDKILADLAYRVLNRRLFKYCSIDKKDQIYNMVVEHGFNPKYYFSQDIQIQNPYKPYSNEISSIWVVKDDGEIVELSKEIRIVSSIFQNNQYKDEKVFFPKEVIND